jgi:hypothetical protein
MKHCELVLKYGIFLLPKADVKPVGAERFKTKSQCFINQNGNFLLPEEGSKPVGTEQIKIRSQCFINQYVLINETM